MSSGYDPLADTVVFIRSSGERTESVCRYSVLQSGFDESHIVILRDLAPFTRVLREGYERAIASGKTYAFFVNADTVVLPEAMETMVRTFDRLHERTFFCNPLTLDYFKQAAAPGNPHLYRIAHLPALLPLIPRDGSTLRPESHVMHAYRARGYSAVMLNIVASLHEFGQYRRDVFQRVMNKYHKNPRLRSRLQELFERNREKEDFAFALDVLARAKRDTRRLSLDARQYREDFASLGMREKDPVPEKDVPSACEEYVAYALREARSYRFAGYQFDSPEHLKRRLIYGLAGSTLFFAVLSAWLFFS